MTVKRDQDYILFECVLYYRGFPKIKNSDISWGLYHHLDQIKRKYYLLKRLSLFTDWKQKNTFDDLLRLRKCNDQISGLTCRAVKSKALEPTADAGH